MTRRLLLGLMAAHLGLQALAAQGPGKQIVKVGPDMNLPFSSAVKAGGLVYLSGTLPTDEKGQVIQGDIKAQTTRALDNLAATLKAAGSSLAQVASVTVYLKRASDFAQMNEVYATYWPKDPPTRTTVVATDLLRGALIEVAMVAIPNGGERQVIHPSDWIKSPNPYSYGIRTGDTLFMAGLISRNGKDNSVVQGDMATQVKTVLDNGAAILKAAGLSLGDVAASRVYITDAAMFQDMNTAYRTYFPNDPPARATVRTGLTGPQYLVEITMVAVKGSRRAITTPNADGSAGRRNPNLSSAIQVGNRLYVSGMLGNTDTTKGDAKAQTREALTRIGRTLTSAGFDWPQVVEGVVYLPSLDAYAAMNEAYREVIPRDFPARAAVGAGLVAPDGLVEIMLTAVK